MKVVYYFGDKYYSRSGSLMGMLYTENGDRYDWGKLQNEVSNGVDVVVREATPAMIAWADKKLEGLQE